MSNPEISAVHRTPPELWKDIFDIAVEWFRHPGGAKDDLANLTEQWNECDQFHRYIKSVSIRKTLRLVCRAWATLVPAMRDNMVFIDHNGRYWPSVEYLETATYICVGDGALACTCKKNPRLIRLAPILADDRHSSVFNTATFKAKCAFIQRYQQEPIPAHLFDLLSPIISLTWLPYKKDIAKTLRQFQNLTHLYLLVSSPPELPLDHDFHLPFLQHLRLKLISHFGLGDCIPHWKLPSLIYLEVIGTFAPSNLADLDSFIINVGGRLRCLVLQFDRGSSCWKGDPGIWDSLPNLSIFGISLNWFFAANRIPEALQALNTSSLTVLLPDMRSIWRYLDIRKVIGNLVHWCQLHRDAIDRIAMNESWISMAKYSIYTSQEKGASFGSGIWVLPGYVKIFFQVIVQSGLPFCDRDKVYLDSEGANWFRHGLLHGFPSSILDDIS